MTISALGGEFALIDRIAAMRHPAKEDSNVLVGIGDDAAVLRSNPKTSILVTTDLLLEDVHFRRSYGDPYSLGVKAAAVNLSDIAAMGGRPTAAFISIALPKETGLTYLDELYRGLNDTFFRFGASIAGGDTNVSPDKIVINVVQMGLVADGGAILRSTARPGDSIIVTGELGAAAAGFALLEECGRSEAERISPEAVTAQLRPEPRISAANAAVVATGITAMMDLSDGLMGDLGKMCRASGVGAIINGTKVPIANDATKVATALQTDALRWALYGGEDYELLITVEANAAKRICEAIGLTGLSATVIGEIVVGAEIQLLNENGELRAGGTGWDHFADV